MEPSSKRRRLAPKVPDAPPPPPPQLTPQPQPSSQAFPQEQHASPFPPQAQEAIPPPPERRDFEAFARHLQDAAMHIYRQTQRSHYSSVSVLLLRWEGDKSVENDLQSLEKVFRERYSYHTDIWQIPTVPNPSIKLGVQIASFLEHSSSDHLSIIYYAGHGYVGHDGQLYWACTSREDASKLKWDGVRCLFEDAQSDMLLLLDSCAVRDAPTAGSHGIKQAMAAYSPEQHAKETGPRSFTACLVDSLLKLCTGQPFSVERLYDEILSRRHPDGTSRSTTGAVKPGPERTPVFFTLTPPKGRGLSLVPLAAKVLQPQSSLLPLETEEGSSGVGRETQGGSPEPAVDLAFDEQRVLVCTTFVGDASPDMTFFNQWLHKPPAVAAKVSVEGMFLGPPTMLMISMPQSIWNVVQHDKVCCFLGLVSSHNMIHLYNRLVNSAASGAVRPRDIEDGRMRLKAREVAASSPGVMRRKELSHTLHGQPDAPAGQGNPHDHASGSQAAGSATSNARNGAGQTIGPDIKDEVEDSAEMQEAAEQLKALSHVRHVKDDGSASADHRVAQVGDSIDVRREDAQSSPDANESSAEENLLGAENPVFGAGQIRHKARRPLQKQIPKQETRCSHCSHAPFKDSSSLRKHIAAAHTRPFPCAFSFAGCTSTFGSKNEWKRHIASQHLCLQYYRCSSCPQGSPEGKGNEFNRKDLFTQHLRRMHAPFAIKKAIAKGDSKLQADWETHVKEMQSSCLVQRRQPPHRSACPKPGCQSVFEGPGSWDEWTEHVGRHMEKGESQILGVDRLLTEWALEEGIIEQRDEGYKLCGGTGLVGGDRDAQAGNNSFISETGRSEDDDPSITVAISLPEPAKMDTD